VRSATKLPLLPSQRIAQICLFLFAAIAIFGGMLQMYLGEPDTTPRLDNIHRFLAGVYLACGFICFWAAWTIRQQNTLVFLIALAGIFGATGRMISMSKVGLPEPSTPWIIYVLVELAVPAIIIISQVITNNKQKSQA
jgi:membrane associated rhomboid family serine protease